MHRRVALNGLLTEDDAARYWQSQGLFPSTPFDGTSEMTPARWIDSFLTAISLPVTGPAIAAGAIKDTAKRWYDDPQQMNPFRPGSDVREGIINGAEGAWNIAAMPLNAFAHGVNKSLSNEPYTQGEMAGDAIMAGLPSPAMGLVPGLGNGVATTSAFANAPKVASPLAAMLAENAPKAAESSLPMDQVSRMSRAIDQGFDAFQPYYHGTPNKGITAFDPRGTKYDGRGGGEWADATFFSENPHFAQTYAGPDGDVHKVFLRGKYFDPVSAAAEEKNDLLKALIPDGYGVKGLDASNDRYAAEHAAITAKHAADMRKGLDLGDWSVLETDEAQQWLKGKGYDGWRMMEDDYNPGAYQTSNGLVRNVAVFDPKNIRSVNAAFDPAKSNSANLLAANAPKAAAPLAALPAADGLEHDNEGGSMTSLVDLFPGKKTTKDGGWSAFVRDLLINGPPPGPDKVGAEFYQSVRDGRAGEYLSGAARTAVNSAAFGYGPRIESYIQSALHGGLDETSRQMAEDQAQAKIDAFNQSTPGSGLTANLGGSMATMPATGAAVGAAGGLMRGVGEVLPEAWQGVIAATAKAGMHPVAAPAVMGAAGAGVSAYRNPNAAVSEHLANGAASAAGTALLGRIPGLIDEVPALGQTTVARAIRNMRAPANTGSPVRTEPQLSFPPQLPRPEAAAPAADPFAGQGGTAGLLSAPMSAAPSAPASGMLERLRASLPSPASASSDMNASIVDLTNAVQTLRGSQGAAVVRPALTPSQATNWDRAYPATGPHVPGAFPLAKQQTVRMPFDETAAPTPAPQPKPTPKPAKTERVIAEQGSLKAGLAKIADAAEAVPSLDVTKLKAPAASQLLGPGYTPAHVKRVLNSAKTQAQTAAMNGEPVHAAIRRYAVNPKTFVPAVALGAGGLLGDSKPADATPDRHSQSGRFLNASGTNAAGDRR